MAEPYISAPEGHGSLLYEKKERVPDSGPPRMVRKKWNVDRVSRPETLLKQYEKDNLTASTEGKPIEPLRLTYKKCSYSFPTDDRHTLTDILQMSAARGN